MSSLANRRTQPAIAATRFAFICFLMVFARDLRAETMPLTLREAVELAVKESPDVQVARFRAAQADSAADQVKSRLLPQLGFDLNTGYQRMNLRAIGLTLPGLADQSRPFQIFDLRPVIVQNLYDPGTHKELLAARERASESQWNAATVRESLQLSVVEAYLGALDYNAQLDASNARLRTAEALVKQASQFVEAGTASRLDENRARIQVANERRSIAELQGKLETQKLLLANLVGLPATTRLELTDVFAPPSQKTVELDAAVSEAFENRPEMHASQARLRAAVADKQKAEAQRYPTASFSADFGRMGNSAIDNISTYTVRAGVHIPILLGGRVQADIHSAEAGIRQAEEEIRNVKLQIETDVHTGAVELNTAGEAYELASQTTALAQKTLELATARFEGGLSNNIEVVNAQESVASAQSVVIRCVFDYFSARAKLARARGDIRRVFE